MSTNRPSFVITSLDVPEVQWRYPNSDEGLGCVRRIGHAAGLRALGVNMVRLQPGHRTSWPHAEEKEEEFVYVLEGCVDIWIDGVTHPMCAGDFAAFPAGTGICHTIINNSDAEAKMLVGGHADQNDNRIFYPLHPQRRNDMPEDRWWHDAPVKSLGAHDALPNKAKINS